MPRNRAKNGLFAGRTLVRDGRARYIRVMPFDPAKACELIAGGESLRSVAKILGCGSHTNILREASENPDFADQYARALAIRGHSKADEIDVLADRVVAGEIAPDIGRVAIDAKKWAASKLLPKVYGDRLHTDNDTRIEVTVRDLTKE